MVGVTIDSFALPKSLLSPFKVFSKCIHHLPIHVYLFIVTSRVFLDYGILSKA